MQKLKLKTRWVSQREDLLGQNEGGVSQLEKHCNGQKMPGHYGVFTTVQPSKLKLERRFLKIAKNHPMNFLN